MRWVTYSTADNPSPRVGWVADDEVHGLGGDATLLDLIAQEGGLERAAAETPAETIALSSVSLHAPLAPPSIRDCTGFLQHLRNGAEAAGMTVDERFSTYPAFYFTNTAAVTGPYDDIAISPGSKQFDFELEVCAVIGRRGSSIALGEARDYLVGYMLFCDWSARDLQMDEMKMKLGTVKGKDGANSLGPMLVTADELEPFRKDRGFDLTMRAYVNDALISEGNWSEVDWSFEDMLVYTSRGTTVHPGEILGSGTVPTGCLFEHFATGSDLFTGWLQPGDQVRLEVENLGTLQHTITASPEYPRLSTGW